MGEDLINFNFKEEYENNKEYYKNIYGDQMCFRNTIYGFCMPVWKAEEMAFIKTMSNCKYSIHKA